MQNVKFIISRCRHPCRLRIPASLILTMGLCALPLTAGIQTEWIAGHRVYTSRPARNPAREEAPQVSGRPSRNKVPPRFADLVSRVSRRHEMDAALVAAVIRVESSFDPMAVSPKGARGLMQLMPATAKQYGVRDIHDPGQNIEAGVSYLSDLREKYRGNMRLALAAFNAGPTAVQRAGGIPDFRETRRYLEKLEQIYGGRLPRSRQTAASVGGNRRQGAIQSARDADGNLIWTNRRSPRHGAVRRVHR